MTVVAVAPAQRRRLGRAQLLAGASVSYDLVEAVVAISAGVLEAWRGDSGGTPPDNEDMLRHPPGSGART